VTVSTPPDSYPDCGGSTRPEQTKCVCVDCGLVGEADRIDHGPEWRHSDAEPDPKRTGAPLTVARHNRGISTEIGRKTDV
jgi:transcription initiation factor TFIIB